MCGNVVGHVSTHVSAHVKKTALVGRGREHALKRETTQNQKKEGGKEKNQQIQKKGKWKNRIRRKERKETTKKK